MPRVVANMASAAAELPNEVVVPLARGIADDVEGQGRRYHVKGRNGTKVKLGAKVRKDQFPRQHQASRVVAGNPAGFWKIIEDGSERHLIAGRYRATGRRRSARVATNQFLRGDSFAGSSPILIPGVGYRQWADHPGHGSVGRPWKRAMAKADDTTAKVTRKTATKQFSAAWFK